MRESAAGRYDPVEADCRFHEAIIAATSNRFYQPLGALVRTALSLTAPITNALFGHSVGDLEAHGEVLFAIEARDEQRAFDVMRGLLSGVAKKVAKVKTLPPYSDGRKIPATTATKKERRGRAEKRLARRSPRPVLFKSP
jgi:DNA-binding FadR family transcriptional regulator